MDQQLLRIKQKDFLDIIAAKTRKCEVCKKDIPYLNEVKRAVEVLHPKAHYIVSVLKDYVDHPYMEMTFNKKFNFEEILQAFHDVDFYKFLVTANLSRRMENLFKETPGQIKLRIYNAILNYNEFKKGQWKKGDIAAT